MKELVEDLACDWMVLVTDHQEEEKKENIFPRLSDTSNGHLCKANEARTRESELFRG